MIWPAIKRYTMRFMGRDYPELVDDPCYYTQIENLIVCVVGYPSKTEVYRVDDSGMCPLHNPIVVDRDLSPDDLLPHLPARLAEWIL